MDIDAGDCKVGACGVEGLEIDRLQLLAVDRVGEGGAQTLEIQQDEGKALVQLEGGNAAMGGSKTQIYGETTVMMAATPALSSAPRTVVPSVVIRVWPLSDGRCGNFSALSTRPELPSTTSPPS